MSLIYTQDQQALSATVSRFVAEQTPLSKVREIAFGPLSYDLQVWRQLSADIGLASLAVPAEFGGDGGTQADLTAAIRELGAGLVPSPLLASAVLAAGTLLALDDMTVKSEWLPKIASGEVVGTLAVSESGARSWIPAEPATTAVPAGGAVALTGTKTAVLNGADADVFLVQAGGDAGPGIYLATRGAAGLTVRARGCMDATRSVAAVTFERTPALPIAGNAAAALDRVADLANLAVAAEQVGATRACLEMTVEYAKVRYSFGQPIGAYQGVKHKLADLYTDWALAEAALRKAAEASANDDPSLPIAAAAARVLSSPACVNAAKHTMLLHGGIGFTWEHNAHLFYRNAVANNVLFGGPEYQQSRLADKLLTAGGPETLA